MIKNGLEDILIKYDNFWKFLGQYSSAKNIVIGLFAISSLSILFAYFVEFILGYNPCILCTYQRYPFYLIMLISTISLIKNSKFHLVIFSSMFLFLGNAFLSSYHSGIEIGVFNETTKCSSGNNLKELDIDKLKNQILSTQSSSCKASPFKMFGISMSLMNFIFSIFMFYSIFKLRSFWLKS
jgi:disulfide bond formation protein DsbB